MKRYFLLGVNASTLRSLRHRSYKIYFFSQLLSQTGSWAQSIAQSWLVYRLTGSAATLGLLSFAEQLPAFLLGPLAGVVCDRANLRWLIALGQALLTVQAIALAFLTLTHHVQTWHVFVLAVFSGLVNSFDIPARQTVLVDLVKKEDIPNAIALNSSLYNTARVIGPALAGLVIGAWGEGFCFAFNALTFLPMIVGLGFINLRHRPKLAQPPAIFRSFQQGISFVWHNESIRRVLCLSYATCFAGFSFLVLMPVMVKVVFKGDARLLGILMSITGVGAVLGSLVLASRAATARIEPVIILSGFVFSLLLVAFGATHSMFFSIPLLAALGFFMVSQMASSNTLIQMKAPEALRGRILSIYFMGFTGFSPLGAVLAGHLANRIGAPLTIILSGAACSLAMVWFKLGFRPMPLEQIQPSYEAACSKING